MIIGMQGFSSQRDALFQNSSDVATFFNSLAKTNPGKTPTSGNFATFSYNSTTVSLSVGSNQLVGGVYGAGFAMCLNNYAASVITKVGEVLTIGCRLVMTQAVANSQPAVAVISTATGASSSAPVYSLIHVDGSTNPYVELEISCIDVGAYRYRGWINGVLRMNYSTGTTSLYPFANIGSGSSWKPSSGQTAPGANFTMKDIYWAFNDQGLEERIGPCFVRPMPHTIMSGSDNPNGQNIDTARANYDLKGGLTDPVTLVNPVVMKANLPNPDPNMRVKALNMTTIGKSTVSGSPAFVTSQIIDSSGGVAGSLTKENTGLDYTGGVAVRCVDVRNVPISDVQNYQFISSREKEDNI